MRMMWKWNGMSVKLNAIRFPYVCVCVCVCVSLCVRSCLCFSALVVVFLCRVCFVRQNRRQNYTFSLARFLLLLLRCASETDRMNEQIINNLRDKKRKMQLRGTVCLLYLTI